MAINQQLTITLAALDKTTAAFDSLNKNLNGLKDAALKVGAALAGAFVLKDIIATTEQWTESVRRLQAETGMTAEAASRLTFAGQALGVTSEELVTAIGRLDKNMFQLHSQNLVKGADVFAKWGVAVRDATGTVLNVQDVLANAATRVRELGDSAASRALEMDLFGRAGGRMHELLLQGAEGVKRLAEESDALGLTLSKGGLEQLHQFTIQSRELGLAFEGLKVQLGILLLPILKDAVTTITSWVQKLTTAVTTSKEFAGVIKVIGDALHVTFGLVKEVLDRIGKFIDDAKSLGVGAALQNLFKEAIDKIRGAFSALGTFIHDTVIPHIGDAFSALGTFVHDKLGPFLGNVFSALGTFVSGTVLPAIGDAFSALGSYINSGQILTDVGNIFSAIGTFVHDVVVPGIGAAFSALGTFIHDVIVPGIGDALSGIGTFIHDVVLPGIGSLFSRLGDLMNAYFGPGGFAGTAFSDFGTAVRGVWDSVGSAIQKAFSAIGRVIGDLVSGALSLLNDLIDKVNDLLGSLPLIGGVIPKIPTVSVVTNIPSEIGTSAVVKVGGRVPSGYQYQFSSADTAFFTNPATGDTIQRAIIGVLGGIGGAGGPPQAQFARGGIVTGPTRALIGEGGPEAVIPLDRAGAMAPNINVYVTGNIATSERELAERIADQVGDVLVRKVFQQRSLGY